MQKVCFLLIIIVLASCSPKYERIYIYDTKGSNVWYNKQYYRYAQGSGCIWGVCTGNCRQSGDTLYFTPKPEVHSANYDTIQMYTASIDFCPPKGIGIIKGDTLYAFGRKYVYSGSSRKYDISYKY